MLDIANISLEFCGKMLFIEEVKSNILHLKQITRFWMGHSAFNEEIIRLEVFRRMYNFTHPGSRKGSESYML
jgi:hypothetical protein